MRRAFLYSKGTVRIELIRDSGRGFEEVPPNWDAAVPITTFMRKLANDGDWFSKRGFYRLFDSDFNDIEE